jgi:hypothetical protein
MSDITSSSRIDMDNLYGLIVGGKRKQVSDLLKKIPYPDRVDLEIDGTPLLNVAAKNKQREMIAVLLLRGLSNWKHCEEGSHFFFSTLEGYLKRDIDCKHPTLNILTAVSSGI